MKYAELRIRRLDKIELFAVPEDIDVTPGDYVIIESSKSGNDYGIILSLYSEPPQKADTSNLPCVIRKVTPEDITQIEDNYRFDEEAFRICAEKIAEKKLAMKLLDAEYSFNRAVVTFYYFAEERVDFRELVRELARDFNCRIEMRQVGRRDEARMMGGAGICGRKLCCSLFLREFKPISMRMVKDQNLPLDPGKLSGLCGRLMCCIAFEHCPSGKHCCAKGTEAEPEKEPE